MTVKFFKSIKEDVLRYRKWLNLSLSGVAIIFALIIGYFIATIFYENMLQTQARATPHYQILYTSVNAKLPKNINESQEAFIIYENKINNLEKQLIDQNAIFSQQISMLNSLYSNTMTYISVIVGLLGLLMIFGGIWLTKKFDNAYNQFIDIHRKIKKGYKTVEEVEKSVTSIDNNIKGSVTKVTEIKNDVEEYNKAIQDALNKNGQKLYKIYLQEHANSISADLKENVENIEYYHSELVTNLTYLSFDEVAECFFKHLEIGGTDGKIHSRYIHLLILIDIEKSLGNEKIFNYLLIYGQSFTDLSFTQHQLIKIIMALINRKYESQNKLGVESLIKLLLRKDSFGALESVLRYIDKIDKRREFIRKLLEFNNEIFDAYTTVWEPVYEPRKQLYCHQLADIALMKEIKQELSQST